MMTPMTHAAMSYRKPISVGDPDSLAVDEILLFEWSWPCIGTGVELVDVVF
jgi:hypothetical protein